MDHHQRITIVVHGRVQGVFYRDSTRKKALELGLVGSVKNLPDGTVQIVAEGTEDVLAQLVQWARSGPPAAAVTSLDVEKAEPTGAFSAFQITG